MKRTTFASAQDVELAFYEALERADLDAMMEVWADDEEVVCVHPGGPRLAGYARVRESWAQIFGSRQRLEVRTSEQNVVQGMMFAIHSLHENITVVGEQRPHAPIAVTNVYVRTASGWRMLVHHASPAPGVPADAPLAEGPKILH
jgi:ketosteroid isomerase-like protein